MVIVGRLLFASNAVLRDTGSSQQHFFSTILSEGISYYFRWQKFSRYTILCVLGYSVEFGIPRTPRY